MTSDKGASVMCPYYITDGERNITCEGIESELIKQRFANKEQSEEYQKRYCLRYPNDCHIARILDRKYES